MKPGANLFQIYIPLTFKFVYKSNWRTHRKVSLFLARYDAKRKNILLLLWDILLTFTAKFELLPKHLFITFTRLQIFVFLFSESSSTLTYVLVKVLFTFRLLVYVLHFPKIALHFYTRRAPGDYLRQLIIS